MTGIALLAGGMDWLGPLHAQQSQFTNLQLLTNREAALAITAPVGRSYRIELATNLQDWNALVTFATNTSTTLQHTAAAAHKSLTIVLTNGASTNVLGLTVEAVSAYNFPTNQPIYHSQGNRNGYVATIGGKRLYLAGDTRDVPEMRALANIDVAFVCMNLPFTMTVDAAASAARQFQPRVVYPYPFSSSDVNRFKQLVGTDLGIEVRLRKWD